MITNTISFAPAWVPGTGSVVARPYACATALPSLIAPLATAQGTRVPAAGMARLRAEVAGFGFVSPLASQHDPISTQNDGTTPLGIQPPGRPKS
ncbi:hypothetical protein [Petropleomorpha daqingensis]|uniref:Uncharacterized protein n=1 Tax=Petropleomorpha daqingensis TaxID=2026353 RepID=A0A853CBM5_9ACTN|nr:hypothetical protein [Petropleomorpha daqingensis]NYJ04539.1 hypothetical protein [Petropleomorpha daqingensis]